MKKNMFKSVHKLFAAAACMSMLLTVFVGCGNPMGGGDKKVSRTEIVREREDSATKVG